MFTLIYRHILMSDHFFFISFDKKKNVYKWRGNFRSQRSAQKMFTANIYQCIDERKRVLYAKFNYASLISVFNVKFIVFALCANAMRVILYFLGLSAFSRFNDGVYNYVRAFFCCCTVPQRRPFFPSSLSLFIFTFFHI